MFNTKNAKKNMKSRASSSNNQEPNATGYGTCVPPLGAHHGPPLGGIDKATSSGRGCLLPKPADSKSGYRLSDKTIRQAKDTAAKESQRSLSQRRPEGLENRSNRSLPIA
jgi:hypothetical protein